jgi:hypothetical protein
LLAVILGNPEMIEAYQAGAPGNGKSFPDGAKMAKIHWNAQKSAEAPDPTTRVPGTLQDVDFMVQDGKRFADSGGWGWAAFKYDAASDTFTPTTLADNPPQGNDAKCGFACHTIGFALILVLSKAGSVAASEFATAEEAKAMLERAVAAVKEDKAKALDMFNNGEGGFKDRGLYVWCANASDGIITAQPYMNKGKQLQGGRASCVAFC